MFKSFDNELFQNLVVSSKLDIYFLFTVIVTYCIQFVSYIVYRNQTISSYTVKPAHAVTYIKQSLVLKGHIFLVLS
jgi:hypothetical protein